MSIEGVYTAEEKRAFVYEYLLAPYGSKGRVQAEHGVTGRQLRRWRGQVFADTLEQGLVPRTGGLVSVEESGALKRLLAENQEMREDLATRDAAHRRELAARDEELARQCRAVDALGKAIEILHASGASRNSTPGPTVASPTSPTSPASPASPGTGR